MCCAAPSRASAARYPRSAERASSGTSQTTNARVSWACAPSACGRLPRTSRSSRYAPLAACGIDRTCTLACRLRHRPPLSRPQHVVRSITVPRACRRVQTRPSSLSLRVAAAAGCCADGPKRPRARGPCASTRSWSARASTQCARAHGGRCGDGHLGLRRRGRGGNGAARSHGCGRAPPTAVSCARAWALRAVDSFRTSRCSFNTRKRLRALALVEKVR